MGYTKKAEKAEKAETTEIEVFRLLEGKMRCFVRSRTGLVYNTKSGAVWKELLYPEKKSPAMKASTAKHNPPEEFRRSVYRVTEGPTLLSFPAVAFKRGLASSALDCGGAPRTQIERLVWAKGDQAGGERVAIYGVPVLRMDIIRQAGQNRAPDVRTRAYLPEWCCQVDIHFTMPTLNETQVANLLAAAGMIRGIGDYRQEKGAGNYGQFELVNSDDADWHRIAAAGGRAVQEEAMENPAFWDDQTEELYEWWKKEFVRRGHDKRATKRNGGAMVAGS